MVRSEESICSGNVPEEKDHGDEDVGVKQSDINCEHDSVVREGHGERLYDL